MRVFHDITSYIVEKQTCVTTGTFDGIHVGHKKILSNLVEVSRQQDHRSVLLTFDPHPRKVLFPDSSDLKLLNRLDEKLDLLEQTGIDDVIIHPFTKDFSRTTALYYVRDLLVGSLNMKKLVIGYDHQFGRNREGSIEQLREMAPLYDFEVVEIPAQDIDNVNVSSTKIRKALEAGDLNTALEYLDYEYFITGKVVKGAGRGRGIGYPTANIDVESSDKLIPQPGVYAVKVSVDGEFFGGMLNIGYNPTFIQNGQKNIEVNIFDFNGDLYNREIRVYFISRIRSEVKFPEVSALIERMDLDKKQALTILASA